MLPQHKTQNTKHKTQNRDRPVRSGRRCDVLNIFCDQLKDRSRLYYFRFSEPQFTLVLCRPRNTAAVAGWNLCIHSVCLFLLPPAAGVRIFKGSPPGTPFFMALPASYMDCRTSPRYIRYASHYRAADIDETCDPKYHTNLGLSKVEHSM